MALVTEPLVADWWGGGLVPVSHLGNDCRKFEAFYHLGFRKPLVVLLNLALDARP